MNPTMRSKSTIIIAQDQLQSSIQPRFVHAFDYDGSINGLETYQKLLLCNLIVAFSFSIDMECIIAQFVIY